MAIANPSSKSTNRQTGLAIEGDVILGIIFMAVFSFTAPIVDVLGKMSAEHMPVLTVSLFRFGIQLPVLAAFVLMTGAAFFPTHHLKRHLMRGAVLSVGMTCFVEGLRHLPLADALAIFFVEPMILTLIGALFMGETIGWRRITACFVGMFGALLVIQPSFVEVGPAALLPVGAAFCFAIYVAITRSCKGTAPAFTAIMWSAIGSTLFVGAALILFSLVGLGAHPIFGFVPPTFAGEGQYAWVLLASLAVATIISHIFITQATKHAPASTLAPIQYLEIVTATLLGLWLYGEFPNLLSWTGIGIIIASGLYILHRERIAMQQQRA